MGRALRFVTGLAGLLCIALGLAVLGPAILGATYGPDDSDFPGGLRAVIVLQLVVGSWPLALRVYLLRKAIRAGAAPPAPPATHPQPAPNLAPAPARRPRRTWLAVTGLCVTLPGLLILIIAAVEIAKRLAAERSNAVGHHDPHPRSVRSVAILDVGGTAIQPRGIQLMRRSTVAVLAILVSPALAAAQEPAPAQSTESAEATETTPGLVHRLFETLVHDIARLPAKENRAILLNGAIVTGAVAPFDRIGTERASSSRALKASFAGVGKGIGCEWVQGGGAIAAYAAGRLWHKPRLTAAAGDLIEAQLVSLTVTQALKFAVGRTRPDGEARSFPSGHASAAFATASTLSHHFGRKAAIPAYAVALYTSLSRLQANSHYASDVVAGATLGLAIARTATIDVGRQRLQIAPAAVPGGAAVAITASRR